MVQGTNGEDAALQSADYQEKIEVEMMRCSNDNAVIIARESRTSWPLGEYAKD
jgi:hypothetical protein